MKFGNEKILDNNLEKCRQNSYFHKENSKKESIHLKFYIFSCDDPDSSENQDLIDDIFELDDGDLYFDGDGYDGAFDFDDYDDLEEDFY